MVYLHPLIDLIDHAHDVSLRSFALLGMGSVRAYDGVFHLQLSDLLLNLLLICWPTMYGLFNRYIFSTRCDRH